MICDLEKALSQKPLHESWCVLSLKSDVVRACVRASDDLMFPNPSSLHRKLI